jgi:hypothetical protein
MNALLRHHIHHILAPIYFAHHTYLTSSDYLFESRFLRYSLLIVSAYYEIPPKDKKFVPQRFLTHENMRSGSSQECLKLIFRKRAYAQNGKNAREKKPLYKFYCIVGIVSEELPSGTNFCEQSARVMARDTSMQFISISQNALASRSWLHVSLCTVIDVDSSHGWSTTAKK